MPILKNIDTKIIIGIIFLWVLIYVFIIICNEDIDSISSLTEDISIQSFSILMGLIIGSVGILIGTISELYSLLINANYEDYPNKDTSVVLGVGTK